jgi:hypothetical protein
MVNQMIQRRMWMKKSKVFLVVTLGFQMAKRALKTHDNNKGVQKST